MLRHCICKLDYLSVKYSAVVWVALVLGGTGLVFIIANLNK